jgi:hypothetical protein
MQFDFKPPNYRTQLGSAGSFRVLNIKPLSVVTLAVSSIPGYRAGFCDLASENSSIPDLAIC